MKNNQGYKIFKSHRGGYVVYKSGRYVASCAEMWVAKKICSGPSSWTIVFTLALIAAILLTLSQRVCIS